jgi:hypothetical protein
MPGPSRFAFRRRQPAALRGLDCSSAGPAGEILAAFFDQPGNIVDSPILCYVGRMDQPTEGMETSVISIAVENRLADLQRRIERRFTDRDQRLAYPADTGPPGQ